MLLRILTLLVAAAALLAPSATAQAPATSFTLETYTTSYGGYFTLEGQSEQNPTLVVPPNTEITITLVGRDEGVHNIQVMGQEASEFVGQPGDTVTYTFTSPASGTVEYWCVPHRAMGMVGDLRVEEAAAPPEDGETQPTPATPDGEGAATPTPDDGGTTTDGGESTGSGNGTPGFAPVTVTLAALGAALLTQRRR